AWLEEIAVKLQVPGFRLSDRASQPCNTHPARIPAPSSSRGPHPPRNGHAHLSSLDWLHSAGSPQAPSKPGDPRPHPCEHCSGQLTAQTGFQTRHPEWVTSDTPQPTHRPQLEQWHKIETACRYNSSKRRNPHFANC